jgi:nucleoid-associated protein YgaU
MGLFDYVKDMGRKLFSKEAEAADVIRGHIEEANPGIEGLEVGFANGTVSLKGSAKNAEAMEKAVLMAGNIQGVDNVDIEGLSAPAVVEKVEYYTIVKGDTLSGIAKRFYGKGSLYPRIFDANREVIQDPDKIFVGQKIRIPLD